MPHFSDPDPNSASKLLYVISSRARKNLSSRARKNLHLIAERDRFRGGGWGKYQSAEALADYRFIYDNVPG